MLSTLGLNHNLLNLFPNLSYVRNTLVEFHISYNNISQIPEQSLDVLHQLVKLNLRGNVLHTIPDVSGPSKTLKTLILDENYFKEFPSLKRLGNSLEELYLKRNMINFIEKDAFQGLNSISYLDLSLNSLQSFPDFHDTKATIETLNVAVNNIGIILPEALAKFVSLTEIDLSKNSIEKIAVIDGNASVVLDRNPIICNVDLSWIVRRQVEGNCDTPSSLSDRNLTSLSYDALGVTFGKLLILTILPYHTSTALMVLDQCLPYPVVVR